jgi:hypothetical protein
MARRPASNEEALVKLGSERDWLATHEPPLRQNCARAKLDADGRQDGIRAGFAAHCRRTDPRAPTRFMALGSAAATSPIISMVDKLTKRNLLKSLSRPSAPEFRLIEAVLRSEIHKALRGDLTDREALSSVQHQVDKAMRAAGYY